MSEIQEEKVEVKCPKCGNTETFVECINDSTDVATWERNGDDEFILTDNSLDSNEVPEFTCGECGAVLDEEIHEAWLKMVVTPYDLKYRIIDLLEKGNTAQALELLRKLEM